jgi:hypothetical protein
MVAFDRVNRCNPETGATESMTKPDAVLRARLDAGTRITLVTSPGGNGYALFDDCSTEIVTSRQRAAGPSRCLREAELLLPLRVGDDVEIRAAVISRGHRSRRLAL